MAAFRIFRRLCWLKPAPDQLAFGLAGRDAIKRHGPDGRAFRMKGRIFVTERTSAAAGAALTFTI